MRSFVKWVLIISLTFFIQQILAGFGMRTDLSFLLVYFFTIKFYFPKEKQRKISQPAVLPLLFSVLIGLLEDLTQGSWGPSIISKSISGFILIKLSNQLFFDWTEEFKGIIIFLFTLLDEVIYSGIIIYFFDFQTIPQMLTRELTISALINVPIGLLLSWRRP